MLRSPKVRPADHPCPRLQMFDLVTEPEVFAAQRAVANEMAPQIEEYIARAEDGLEELKQRERALHAKVSRRGASHPGSSLSAV